VEKRKRKDARTRENREKARQDNVGRQDGKLRCGSAASSLRRNAQRLQDSRPREEETRLERNNTNKQIRERSAPQGGGGRLEERRRHVNGKKVDEEGTSRIMDG
jgi:hypothetical protein